MLISSGLYVLYSVYSGFIRQNIRPLMSKQSVNKSDYIDEEIPHRP